MRKVFHLSTCNTCQKILTDTYASTVCALQDIKVQNIQEEELDWLASKVGSYEALFNRKAIKFRLIKQQQPEITEGGYRQLILDEYTFLKRPVIIVDEGVYVGNLSKNVQDAKAAIEKAQ